MTTDQYTIKISNPYILDSDDKALVDKWKSEGNISANDWYDDRFSKLKKKIKSHYIQEQKNRCCYCLQEFRSDRHDEWDLEHIVPRSAKPTFMFEPINLCVSCKLCNSKKDDYVPLVNKKVVKVPVKSDRYKMFHVHMDDYKNHITCTFPGDFYKALDDKGVETITNCGLLRFYRFADRDVPDPQINDLARGVITSVNNTVRDVLEIQLLKKLLEKHPDVTL
ncbi:hypothetical protein P3674_03675 [Vibrio parahaemolyticus]|uniref:HNH endonuclease n=1 Tax=Vibrio parahaemolyticus TaxID=670 RepID=UPI001120B450|nr:hypothetical protein [Vibrio parahaemolyticus]EGR2045013.1 hypothetical protein [Vibrio parahaemolyticus]EJE4708363.1 hypothetical protein [Vibrio parahaemolyticus]MBE4165322.1 hypothetical protein [Vibrio parahaemolyticus]MCR9663177.1 HNH endonuclease [Vibrio parahaemolyticus]MCR9677614.1 HNH endonuclease [Vibrio parahaemolyticus]